MDTTLKIIKEQVQGKVSITVLHLRGWLDVHSEELLLAEARDAYEKGSRFILIDLAKIDALTSAGMRVLQKVFKLFTPAEEKFTVVRVKLCNAPSQVHHILGITGFLQNIPNYETTQAAIDFSLNNYTLIQRSFQNDLSSSLSWDSK